MGEYCQEVFDDGNTDVIVTSRSEHFSNNKGILFIRGDAMNLVFLKHILNERYDAIIDFMLYDANTFATRIDLLLKSTKQYFFLSSARVYADQDRPITEKDPRLIDISDDSEYLQTQEYAIEKARCENILSACAGSNYTIIRPYITYSEYRLQLGVLEKENWLYRVLHGRSIVFSEDIAGNKTTMTFGRDVAVGINALIGNKEAFGETYNITLEKSYSWNEILACYLNTLKRFGIEPKVFYTKKATSLKFPANKYQVLYCRYFNRAFNNDKIRKYVDLSSFTDTMEGVDNCLWHFLEKPHFGHINWILEAFLDKAAHEMTPLREIGGFSAKLRYLIARYTLYYELRLRISPQNLRKKVDDCFLSFLRK